MATYFISDLHLDLSAPAMTEGFLRFIESLNDAEALYILGDFFEAWIGDDVVTPMSDAVAASLLTLSQQGCSVYIMHGNRDFLMGEAFCQRCGAELLSEGALIPLGSQQAVVLHGDSLCTDDVQYQAVRTMLRNPAWQAQTLAKSVEERIQMAQQARMQSQESNAEKDDDIMDVNQSAVDAELDRAGVTLMIHGHTHRPADHHWQHSAQSRRRLVLGDWSDHLGWMIRFDASQSDDSNAGITLSSFEFAAL